MRLAAILWALLVFVVMDVRAANPVPPAGGAYTFEMPTCMNTGNTGNPTTAPNNCTYTALNSAANSAGVNSSGYPWYACGASPPVGTPYCYLSLVNFGGAFSAATDYAWTVGSTVLTCPAYRGCIAAQEQIWTGSTRTTGATTLHATYQATGHVVVPGMPDGFCAAYDGKIMEWGQSSAHAAGSLDQSVLTGSENSWRGQLVCAMAGGSSIDFCQARIISADCTMQTVSSCPEGITGSGPGSPCDVQACGGSAMYSIGGLGCSPSANKVVAQNVKDTAAKGAQSISPGGKGAGSAQSATTADINLGRIATNTADMLAKMEAGTGVGGSGGSCGGASQPACKIDELDTSAHVTNLNAYMNADKTAMEAEGDGVAGMLKGGSAPSFLGDGATRWLVSFAPALPTASCTLDVAFNKFGVSAFHISVCSWGTYVRAALGWMVGLMTMFGIWFTIFRR